MKSRPVNKSVGKWLAKANGGHGQWPNHDRLASEEFAEWASFFAGSLFVKIVAFADESGTHDQTGAAQGAREATVAGLATTVETWTAFCDNWEAGLVKFGAPYFHFSEWAEASAVARRARKERASFAKNPYRGWDEKKLNAFLLELAGIIGDSDSIIIGGGVRTNVFHQSKIKGKIAVGANPYEACARVFFDSFLQTVALMRPAWSRLLVSFFFDHSDDKLWRMAVVEGFYALKKVHPNFEEITFADKKNRPHLPLQAADMIAYRTRQLTGKMIDGKTVKDYWPELDQAIFKSTFDFLDKNGGLAFSAYLLRSLTQE